MAYFGSGGVVAETREETITGGYKVKVGRLTNRQADECQAILSESGAQMEITARPGEQPSQKIVMTMQDRRFRTATLVRDIREWNLDEADGQVAPIDEAHVGQLLDDDANRLFVAIKRFNEPLTDAQKGN